MNGYNQEYSFILPASLENRDTVYLRWVYWMVFIGDGGAREKLGLSNIQIAETPAAFAPGYPNASSTTADGATLNFKTDLPSKIFYVVSTSATAPDAATLLADATLDSAAVGSTESSKAITGKSASTQYYVHYLLKMGGLTSAVSTISFTTEAPLPAGFEFIAGFPALSDTSYSSINLNVKVSEAGQLYYVLSATQQSFADLAALKLAAGVVDSTLAASTEKLIALNNLSANTAYYLYCAAENSGATEATAVVELPFTTHRNLVSFASGYPKTAGVVYNGFKLLSKVDKNADLYYVVSTTTQSYANAAALIAATGAVGPKAITANREDTISVESLAASTAYHIYAVAKNADNEETVVADLQVNTPSNAPSFTTSTAGNITNSTFDYTVTANKNATLYYLLKRDQAQNPIYTAAELVAAPGVQTQSLTANTEWTHTFTNTPRERRYYVYSVLFDGTDYSAVKRTVKNGDFFGIEGELAPGTDRATTPRTVEVITPQHLDISSIPNSKIISNLNDSVIWKTPLGNDFSATVTRTVRDTAKKTDGNTYAITVKNLLPADNLPLNLTFHATNNPSSNWSRTTKGWATAGADLTGYPSVIRMGTNNVSFVVSISDIPGSITYELNTVGSDFINKNPNPEYLVEASANGVNWITLEYFTKDRMVPQTATAYTNQLGDSIRFIRYYYKVYGANLNVNKVNITQRTGYPYFTASYPQLNSISSQGVDLGLKLDATGTAYYKYSTTPLTLTAAQLEAQGTPVAMAAATEELVQIRGLSENTPYYLYVVAKNADGKYSAVKEYNFRTLSNFPSFVAGYPQLGLVGKDSMLVNVKVQKDSKVHYLITTTKKAAGYTNANLMAEAHDSISVSANVQKAIAFKNLTWETRYYLYFTTRDEQGNMATLAALDTVTQSPDRNANIITFSVAGQTAPAAIDATLGLVTVQVPSDMPLTAIKPTFTLHSPQAVLKTTGNVVITSGVTELDFTDTLRCIATSEDPAVSKPWRIKVNATGGVLAPKFTNNAIVNITDNSFDYTVTSDKDATLYYVVQSQAQDPIYTAQQLHDLAGVQTQSLTANTAWTTTMNNKPRSFRYYVYSVLFDSHNNASEVKSTVKGGDLFTIAGALAPASNRATSPRRTIEVVVPQSIDISNIPSSMIISSLPDSSVWTEPLPNDYSEPVLRSVKDTAKNTTTDYTIIVKNLLPADNLPLNLTFHATNNPSSGWNRSTRGWATAGADLLGYPGVIRLGTNGVSLVVGISDIAKSISYELNTVGADFTSKNANPEFLVEASADGNSWITLEHFTKDRKIPQTATAYTDNLGDSIRYVRFYYKTYGANVNVNKINVLRSDGHPYFANGYPLLDNISTSSADLQLKLDQTARVSYRLYTLPQTLTPQQLSADVSALHENIAVGATFQTTLSPLIINTSYYLYVVAKNDDGKFSAIKEYNFRTLGNFPNFMQGYPKISKVDKKQLDVKLNVEKACFVYYVVSTEAKSAAYNKDSIMATASRKALKMEAANLEQTLSIKFLNPSTHYYLYFTTRDEEYQMADMVKLEAATLPADRNADIITFSIYGELQPAVIDTGKALIVATIPAYLDLTDIIPTFTLKTTNGVLQTENGEVIISNSSHVDFTDTLRCIVLAEDVAVSKSWRIKVNQDNSTAVAKNELQFTFYPNPFTSELYFSSPDEVALVQIINMQGVVVHTQAGASAVQTAHLPKGMYVLKLQSKSGKTGAKLVVKQ